MLARGTKCPCCGQALPPRDIYVDLNTNTIVTGGKIVFVTRRLAEILAVLAAAWPETVVREQIITRVWGLYNEPCQKTIETYVTKARHLLRPLGYGVKNSYGVGYRLVRL